MRYDSLRYSHFIRISSFLRSFQIFQSKRADRKIIFSTLPFIDLTRIARHSEEFPCIGIEIGGYLMSPPELTRDAPVTEIVDPVFEGFIEPFRDDLEVFFLVSDDYFLGHDTGSHEPLCRDDGFDTTVAAFTESDLVCIGFYPYQISLAPQEFYDIRTSLKSRHESGKNTCLFRHDAILIDDSIVCPEGMLFRHFEISRIMSGSDLHDASSEFHIDHLIGDDGDLTIDDREYDRSSYEFLVPLILRVDGDRLVCEECLWASRRDEEFLITS